LDDEVWFSTEPFFVPQEQERAPKPLRPTTPKKRKENIRKMPTAYILLNTQIGAETQVLKALKRIEGVIEAHSLWGVYDIIANVKANSIEELKSIITKQIEKVGQINSKLTMMIADRPPSSFTEQIMFEQPAIIQ
jgi:DNA-binding Lrp family transcriptional regulator